MPRNRSPVANIIPAYCKAYLKIPLNTQSLEAGIRHILKGHVKLEAGRHKEGVQWQHLNNYVIKLRLTGMRSA